MSFTEFTCRSGGSNLYAGSLDGSAEASTTPLVTYTNGGFNSSTGVFTPASGNPVTAGVAVGHFVSVYTDGASAPTGFVARVTAVSSTTITLSTTAKSGTAPTTAASGLTAVVGGAWAGPSGASGFPFGFVQNTLTNAAGDRPRINGKGTNNITANIASNKTGPITWQGYTTTFGDGGKWTIDGGTSGTAFPLLTQSGANNEIVDMVFQNNGAASIQAGLEFTAFGTARRVIANSLRGNGIQTGNNVVLLIECEAYACNQNNSANQAGINMSTGAIAIRCVSHDNVGSNTHGFYCGERTQLYHCIADSNGKDGFSLDTSTLTVGVGLDAYNNGGSGINLVYTLGQVILENCNLVKNGAYGINGSGAGVKIGFIANCAFGSGTQANTSGQTNGLGALLVTGSITYAANVTPWTDPANGDFRISLAAAKGTGRGSFTETASGYAGTVAYPDIGAAQHLETASGLPLGRTMGGI